MTTLSARIKSCRILSFCKKLLNTILILMRKKNGAETTSFTVHPSYLLTGINCQTITTLKI